MEIEFREKKKYCKDADMYLFDMRNTKKRKLEVRKIIKIILIIEVVACVIAFQSGVLSAGRTNHVNIGLLSFAFTALIMTLGVMIGFFILNKIGFGFAETIGRSSFKRIGGKNSEKYVDADVNIVFNDDKLIWTRAANRLEIEYEEIKKVEETDEYIYILINTQSVIWIPKEAFISTEERGNFLNYVNLKIQEK